MGLCSLSQDPDYIPWGETISPDSIADFRIRTASAAAPIGGGRDP